MKPIAALAMGAGALAAFRWADHARVQRIWRSIEIAAPRADGVFQPDLVASLPAPARRYFERAIRPGTPLSRCAILRMRGEFRPSPKAKWMPMSADEIVWPPAGFVWRARAGRSGLWFSGADVFLAGAGRVRFWIWDLLPLINQAGPQVARSARGRLAGESLWTPAELLPQFGTVWEDLGGGAAKATLEAGGEKFPLALRIAEDGRIESMSMPRFRDGERHTFGIEASEDREFAGYRIPSKLAASWDPATDRRFEFFRAEIESAKFL